MRALVKLKQLFIFRPTRVLLLACLLCSFFVSNPLVAEEREQSIKLGYLYNFLQFMNWPSQSLNDDTIQLCIYGDNPFGNLVFELNNKVVHKRLIVVNLVANIESLDACHALFISRSARHQLTEIIAHTADNPILTISEIRTFTRKGGLIGLALNAGRLSIEINLSAVKRAGLTVSSPLLRVSRMIE